MYHSEEKENSKYALGREGVLDKFCFTNQLFGYKK